MEQDQYTGKSDAMPRRAEEPPRVEIGNEPPGNARAGVARGTVWAVVAVALGVGLFLYFRFGPAVVPLFDRGH